LGNFAKVPFFGRMRDYSQFKGETALAKCPNGKYAYGRLCALI